MKEEIITWYKENLQQKVREGLKLAAHAFFATLWDFLKEDIILSARKSLKRIEQIAHSEKGEKAKKKIVDLIMTKIKLPIVIKPFKGIVKKVVENKIEEIIDTILEKGDNALNNKLRIIG